MQNGEKELLLLVLIQYHCWCSWGFAFFTSESQCWFMFRLWSIMVPRFFFLRILLNTMCSSHAVFMSLLCPTQINNFAFVAVKIHLLSFCLMLQLNVSYLIFSVFCVICRIDYHIFWLLIHSGPRSSDISFDVSLQFEAEYCTLIEYDCASNSISI